MATAKNKEGKEIKQFGGKGKIGKRVRPNYIGRGTKFFGGGEITPTILLGQVAVHL